MNRKKIIMQKNKNFIFLSSLGIILISCLILFAIIFSFNPSEHKNSISYFFLLTCYILLFLFCFITIFLVIKHSKKRVKEVVEFLDKNNYYNTCSADFKINNDVSIIKNYIFIITAKPKIIDLSTCKNFKLIYHRPSGRIGAYHEIMYLNKFGEEKRESLRLLDVSQQEILKSCIKNYSNYIGDIND